MGKIIDVNSFDFSASDRLIISVDTNVLLCMFYVNITYSLQPHQKVYQSILEKLIENKDKVKLCTTTINICEALHVIEKTEHDIYQLAEDRKLNIKAYRNMVRERVKIKKVFEAFILQVRQYIDVIDEYVLSNDLISQYIIRVTDSKYDCLDYALVDYSLNNKVDAIITDDSDFNNKCDNIKILTANPALLIS